MLAHQDVSYAIDAFQHYVVSHWSSRAPSWPDARKLIQRISAALAEQLARSGTKDVREAARILGVRVVSVDTSALSQIRALLAPSELGLNLVAAFPNGEMTPRVRFSVAHELGHSFFYCSTQKPVRRLIPTSPRASKDYWREEDLCDAFAGALLVPAQDALELVAKGPSLARTLATAQELGVSGEVVVRRILHDMKAWPGTVVYRILRLDGGKPEVRVFKSSGAGGPTPSAEKCASALASGPSVLSATTCLKYLGFDAHEIVQQHRSVTWLRV